jgi:hypothetical protein
MLLTIGKAIARLFMKEIVLTLWDSFLNFFADWQAGREARLLAKAIQDLKDAQTLEDRRKAQDDVIDRSF